MNIFEKLLKDSDKERSELTLDPSLDVIPGHPVIETFSLDSLADKGDMLDYEVANLASYFRYIKRHPGPCGYEAVTSKVFRAVHLTMRHDGAYLHINYQGKNYCAGECDGHVFTTYMARIWYAPHTLEYDEQDEAPDQILSDVPQRMMYGIVEQLIPIDVPLMSWVQFQRGGQVMYLNSGSGADFAEFMQTLGADQHAISVGVYGFSVYDQWVRANPHIPVGVIIRSDPEPERWAGDVISREGALIQAYALIGQKPQHKNLSMEIVRMSPCMETYRLLAITPSSLGPGAVVEAPSDVVTAIGFEAVRNEDMAILDTEGPELASDWSCYFVEESRWYEGKSFETFKAFLDQWGDDYVFFVKGIGREKSLFTQAGHDSTLRYTNTGWRGILEVNNVVSPLWVQENGLHIAREGVLQVYDIVYKTIILPSPDRADVGKDYIFVRSAVYGHFGSAQAPGEIKEPYRAIRTKSPPPQVIPRVLIDQTLRFTDLYGFRDVDWWCRYKGKTREAFYVELAQHPSSYEVCSRTDSVAPRIVPLLELAPPQDFCRCGVPFLYVWGGKEGHCKCGLIVLPYPMDPASNNTTTWWARYSGAQTFFYYQYLKNKFLKIPFKNRNKVALPPPIPKDLALYPKD